ncbi:transcriptional regulator AhrC/ArgR [Bacillus marinisedimentorum]|uniref:transcriptional regulator AhrC/ArgR n=1 Tax=Bacillus marinisedimentorum TaxID=1821260 RepID=UPI000871F22D|nr:transcriptional regulator ArgR [Bacillus marinisedimentorum]
MQKALRHAKIRELITAHEAETQDQITEMLREAGFSVTQATVSRDIKELQLVKVPMKNGRSRYSLPADQSYQPLHKLRRALQDAFVQSSSVGQLVILKTMPGNAHVIGALLDELDWEEMMGTICGNDNCLIICREEVDAVTLEERLHKMLDVETRQDDETILMFD